MVQGKSNKPDFLDGRKNGQGQFKRQIKQANKEFDKMNKEVSKIMDEILK